LLRHVGRQRRAALQAMNGGFMLETTGEPPSDASVFFRTDLRPGDIGAVIELHGRIYSREYGFDYTFEAYVAGPLAEFARSPHDGERIWLAERQGKIVGCIAIVASAPEVAQLRWFLVDPSARGLGIGKTLIHEAVAFCRACGYKSVILRTVSVLTAAANLYRSMGFQLVERKPVKQWGVDVIEERYELNLE
jgi:ribosomal protein S18 acetylase RimI-like enzyme